MWKARLKEFLIEKKIKFTGNKRMSEITSMMCGGIAGFLVEPSNVSELSLISTFLKKEGIVYKVVGSMTNTLPCDAFYCGVLLRLSGFKCFELCENNTIYAGAGMILKSLVRQAMEVNVGGFEELSGIPGTLGGALFGNSGAHGRSISDAVISVDVYDAEKDELLNLSGEELCYGYRCSIFKLKRKYIILGAKLLGIQRSANEIYENIKKYEKYRQERQPLNMPSLGSVFMHPEGDFAPRLIESLGFKGLTYGGAMVSKKHAGFIVNVGNATAEDVKHLIMLIKKRVFEAYKIELKEEIDIM